MSRGEPAQPKSEPVKDVTEPAPSIAPSADHYWREFALQMASTIPRPNPSVEQLLKDAKAIELYLKGETE